MELVRRARGHWLFGLVLLAALALRVLASLAFRPIMWFGRIRRRTWPPGCG